MMKKIALTIAVVLGLTVGSFAQGGLFERGETPTRDDNEITMPLLPAHGQTENVEAPIGCGALLLVGFGAAYAMSKRNK